MTFSIRLSHWFYTSWLIAAAPPLSTITITPGILSVLLESGERDTVKVRHLAQAHDAMIQLGFRNHTYSPQVQCTDNKATESPTSKMRGGGGGREEEDTEEQNGEKEKLQNERMNKVD